jgi:hypothetical protein
MKNKKRYIILGLIFLIVFISLIFVSKKEKLITNTYPIDEKNIEENTPAKNEIPVKEKTDNIFSTVSKDEIINKITVSLEILDKKYLVKVNDGATVYEVMKIARDQGFYFNGKEHLGLGFFVEEINGVRGNGGKYWMYYVNDKEAELGISRYIIKKGDIISWKLK